MQGCRQTRRLFWLLIAALTWFSLPATSRGDEFDSDLQAFEQQPAVPYAPSRPSQPARRLPPQPRTAQQPALVSIAPRYRLASVPDMFGDAFTRGGTIIIAAPPRSVMVDTPLAGGARGVKVAENNKAVPMDRAYFTYNHFHNALRAEADPGALTPLADSSIDRYTLAVEKSFACRQWSLEARMPWTNGYDLDVASIPGTSIEAGEVGNLAVIFKRLVLECQDATVVAGLGVEVPTGSDATVTLGGSTFTVDNEAVFLLPYLGLLSTPSDAFFYHGFAQLALAANGNDVTRTGAGAGPLGEYNDQNLLYLDFSAGYWLYRCPCETTLSGLAAVLELHYTATLQDTDVVTTPPAGIFELRNRANQVDVVNLTAGLNVELARQTSVHVAGVFPLRDDDNRFFDAEVLVQVNRRF